LNQKKLKGEEKKLDLENKKWEDASLHLEKGRWNGKRLNGKKRAAEILALAKRWRCCKQ